MIHYLYQALTTPLGVCLQVSDVEAVRQRLYTARREAADPLLDALALVPSPTAPDELWIVKRGSKIERTLSNA